MHDLTNQMQNSPWGQVILQVYLGMGDILFPFIVLFTLLICNGWFKNVTGGIVHTTGGVIHTTGGVVHTKYLLMASPI